jgi:hypothetical protein
VRAEIRKAAVLKQTVVAPALPRIGQVTTTESGLIWALMRAPEAALAALAELEEADLDGLASRAILQQARSLQEWPAPSLPKTLIERLSKGEAELVEEVGRRTSQPADPMECVRRLRTTRLDRERAAIQREISRLQELGAAEHDGQIVTLMARKIELLQQIETLMTGGRQ